MKVYLLVFMIQFITSNSQPFNNETQLVFTIDRKDIKIVNFKNKTFFNNSEETNLILNSTTNDDIIGGIDYSIRANILIWRQLKPQNGIYAIPIDKRYKSLIIFNLNYF
jgi:hypothetical protein